MNNLKIKQLLIESKTYENFKNKLLELIPDITIKENKDNDLVLIANKYKVNNFNLSKLERELKQIIIDKNTLELIVYTYDSIFYNEEANMYLLNNDISESNKNIYESFEGTQIIVYNYNNNWNISTRKCLDASNSKWNSYKSYYNLFVNSLGIQFNDFINKLDETKYYIFILVNYENKNIIDYTSKFGEKYTKIINILIRDSKTHEEININNNKIFEDNENFYYPTELNDYSILNEENKKNNIDFPLKTEGIVTKINNNNLNNIYLKFQTNSYKIINKILPNNNNIIKMFISLYKDDLLKEHILYFPDNLNIKLKNIDNEDYTIYETVLVIDNLFKIFTSELFELFKFFYCLKDCSKRNEAHYELLPTSFKVILYKLRGIYFDKKEKLAKIKEKESNINYKNYNLKITDIYNFLKNYELNNFYTLINDRVKIISNDTFNLIKNKCDINNHNLANKLISNI